MTFAATGAQGGVSFAESGGLPAGVTPSQGSLAGTPTEAGTFAFTVTATDRTGCAVSAQYQLAVTSSCSDGGMLPDGGCASTKTTGCGCGTDSSVPLGFGVFILAILFLRRRRVELRLKKHI